MRRTVAAARYSRQKRRKNLEPVHEVFEWAVVVCTMIPGTALYTVAALEHSLVSAKAQCANARTASAMVGAATTTRTTVFASKLVFVDCEYDHGRVFAIKPTTDAVAEAGGEENQWEVIVFSSESARADAMSNDASMRLASVMLR